MHPRNQSAPHHPYIKTILIALLAIATIFSGMWPMEKALAGSSPVNIVRVALFVDTGQYYRNTVPTISLSSKTGMDIGTPVAQGTWLYPQAGDAGEVRFSAEGYYLQVGETSNPTDAQRIAQQLSRADISSEIRYTLRNGQPFYQITTGTKPNRTEVEQLRATIAQKAGLNSVLKGPFRVESGIFADRGQAAARAGQLNNAGITSYVVLSHAADGKPQYRVWAGDEVDAAAQSALATRIKQAIPNIEAAATSGLNAYLLIKQDAVFSGGQTEFVPHYIFSSAQKVLVMPRTAANAVPLTTVEEKGNRSYRGVLELSVYAGKFTVVNQLPLEEYLYGVVGTEMATGWPLEALKAQAVLARTRVLGEGNKYGVAQVSDSTWEQAYKGYTMEASDIRRAVDETAGVVLTYNGKLAQSLYYSNAGGMTADGVEVWGNRLPYISSVSSDDTIPEEAADTWYRVALADGDVGYVHADFVTVLNEANPLGLRYAVVNTDGLNFRRAPDRTESPVVRTLSVGMRVVIIEETKESNAYHWIRGPYTATEMMNMINQSQANYGAPSLTSPVQDLTVTQYGPSGRVMEVKANGMIITAKTPDSYRSVFRQGNSSLRSTKFNVEQTGQFVVLGANGKTATYPGANGGAFYAISGGGGGGTTPFIGQVNGNSENFMIYNADKRLRVASKTPGYRFIGYGYGHGYGLSQYGAKAMALEGFDFRQILQHYYQGAIIEVR